jgi:mannose-6-phosphate isomerase-like protein (cupin superfamily)
MPDQKRTKLALIHRHTPDFARRQQLGPYGIESLVEAEEEGAGTVYRVSIEAMQRTSIAYHRIAEEYYFVLSGRGVALLDGIEHPIETGDFLRLPPGMKHGFLTADEPLEMLNIHTPGSRPDRDVYFDEEAPEGFGRIT